MTDVPTKVCSKCKVDKSISEFAWRNRAKGTLNSWCKSCLNTHEAERLKDRTSSYAKRVLDPKRKTHLRLAARKLMWDYLKSHPCVVCGESDPIVLEFDHRDSTTKHGDVSDMVGRVYGLDTLLKEFEKCDVMCANCHRRKTAKQFNWFMMKEDWSG